MPGSIGTEHFTKEGVNVATQKPVKDHIHAKGADIAVISSGNKDITFL